MRAVDTNVLVRLFTGDNPRECAAAERFVADGAWVPTLAVVETAWVLKRAYGRGSAELSDWLEMLLQHETLVLEDQSLIAQALTLFREHPALGLSDCVMLATARRADHLPLGTFDRRLGRLDGAQRL